VYYVLPGKFRNFFLLLSSLFFYAWGAPGFVVIIMASVAIDFFLLRWMSRKEDALRKWIMRLSVMLNLGLLLYFKYMNFFVEQFNELITILGTQPSSWTQIALPVGISFITFQKMACTLDMYKRRFKGFERIQDYAVYIFMFPQLLSGPIVRPGEISTQISVRTGQGTIDDRLSGFYRFMIGLSKKVIIADTLGVTVNEIFALGPGELSTGMAWTGAIAYTFQIYFDFSGYSDMAIGLARMLGFRLPENFNFPYVAQSITEFWRRWHITLSLWFRDYLFLPLAYAISRKLPREKYLGLRADKIIYLLATTVTFLLCGFWHGAAWTFIVWGGYMGLFLILDRIFLLKYLKKSGRIPSTLFTFLILIIGWIIFRSATLNDAWFYISRMFGFQDADNIVWLNPKFWTMLVLAALFSFGAVYPKATSAVEKLYLHPGNKTIILFTVIAILLFILNEATITSTGFSPFIYFRF
jgi:alginate O-acetyltransferase complex protein AlgI